MNAQYIFKESYYVCTYIFIPFKLPLRARSCNSELKLKVNCNLHLGLVCYLLAILNSFSVYNSLSAAIHLNMIQAFSQGTNMAKGMVYCFTLRIKSYTYNHLFCGYYKILFFFLPLKLLKSFYFQNANCQVTI